METFSFFATAARGTEPALRDELRELRFRHVRADRGGVQFEGELSEAGRACLWSALAVRILVKVGEGDARDGQALYDTVRAIDFARWLGPKQTLAASAVSRASALTHTQFIAQKAKDAIVDAQRDRHGERSSVDLDDADVRVFLHVVRDRVQVYLDASGESLHRRGWRTRIGLAPLKENLAAAMLRIAGWDRTEPLIDPMCGSGTIAIEAALTSRGVAPGIARPRFGLERWASVDETLTTRLRVMRQEARDRIAPEGPPIDGVDIDPMAVEAARFNASSIDAALGGAGLSAQLRLSVGRIGDYACGNPAGFLVTNPPYDERMPSDPALQAEIARGLDAHRGGRVALLCGDPGLPRAIKHKPSEKVPLWNGALECRLMIYDL